MAFYHSTGYSDNEKYVLQGTPTAAIERLSPLGCGKSCETVPTQTAGRVPTGQSATQGLHVEALVNQPRTA